MQNLSSLGHPEIFGQDYAGVNDGDMVNKARSIGKAKEQSIENADFADDKGDDPHARGAESNMDFIMGGN